MQIQREVGGETSAHFFLALLRGYGWGDTSERGKSCGCITDWDGCEPSQVEKGGGDRLWQPGTRACQQPVPTTCATAASSKSSLRPGSASAAKAENAGFKVVTNAKAAKWTDIVMVLAPGELQASLYNTELRPYMRDGTALAVAHGLSIHFQLIEPRPDMDVFMIAPKGPGHTVRSEYLRGAGVPCLLAVEQNPSGNAVEIALSSCAR
jgi:Acetohydroxy acid isomeroreductase, NADPH-binding domain